jgi:hypothetical protein
MLIYFLQWWPSWISDHIKNLNFVKDLPLIIPGQFGFNCPMVSEKKRFETFFP